MTVADLRHSTPPRPRIHPTVSQAVGGATHCHAVQFYHDEAFLAGVVGDFVMGALAAEQPAIVIATEPHREAFAAHLQGQGIDVAAARRNGLLTEVDARATLASFMVGSLPDEERFQRAVGSLIHRARRAGSHASIRAYGEMVDLLWADGNASAALRLEELWNQLATTHEFSLLCAYAMGRFSEAAHTDAFRSICGSHTHVVPTERYAMESEEGRLLEITMLQQRAFALQTEIERREALEAQLLTSMNELRRREQELGDILTNAAEGIHFVDAQGIVIWANRAELDMLGYKVEEFVGRHIAEFHADRHTIDDFLQRLARGETLRDRPARLKAKDGSIRHVLVSSSVHSRNGEPVHTRCFTRDITALQRASAEREHLLALERAARAEAEQAKRVAEQANRAKSDFLAVMSHELRTPLNAIGGYAELMEFGIHGVVSEGQRDLLERIQRSQRHLLGLINQVLNYARVDTGNVRYELADVPLDEVLRSADALVLPQLRAKGLRYAYAGCASDVAVRADREKFHQILLNLLANAVKFTDRGGEVRLECEVQPETVRVHVRDTGIGIPSDKLSAIFDPFVQVDPNYTRTKDGVGLGLAISRDLARGMHGELSAQSKLGEGSTFTLTLQRSRTAL